MSGSGFGAPNVFKIYENLFENTSAQLAYLDSDYNFIMVNASYVIGSGYRREELISRSYFDVFPNDEDRQLFEKVKETGQGIEIKARSFKQFAAGDISYKDWTLNPVKNDIGAIQGFALSLHDVTEWVSLSQPIPENNLPVSDNEERYRAFYENSLDAMLITSPDGGIEAANPAACKMFGMPETELIKGGRNGVVDLSDPRLKAALEERARTGKFKGELNYRRKDGTTFPGEISTAFFTDRNGLVKTAMIIRDITERKRVEEKLRESEERFRAVQENSLDRFTILKPFYNVQGEIVDFTYVYQNAQAAKTAGRTPEELVGRRMTEIFPTFPQTRFFAIYKQTVETGQVTEFEDHYHADGVDDWFRATVTPIPDGIAVATQIITERRRVEEALRESEEKYRLLFENMTEMFQILEPIFDDEGKTVDFRYIEINQASKKLVGEKGEGIEGKTAKELWGTVEDYWLELLGKVLKTGESAHMENYSQELDTYYDLYAWKANECRVAIVFSDVTESKRSKEELQTSENRFRMIFERSPVGISMTSPSGKLRVNQAFADMLGYSIPELESMDFTQISYPDDQAESNECLRDFLSGKRDSVRLEKRYLHKNGSIIWVDASSTMLKDTAGAFLHTVTSIINITERKVMEDTLRTSELRFRQIAEAAIEGLLIHENGRFVDVNSSLLKIIGYEYGELIGQPILDYIDPAYHELVQKQFRNSYEIEIIHRDGTRIPVEVLAKPFVKEGQVAVSIYDLRQLKHKEQVLRESEERYRGFVQNTSAVILRIDPQGVIRFANQRALEFFGYAEAELIGKPALGAIVPEQETTGRDLSAMVEEIVANPDQFHTNANENMRKSGERIWMEWTNSGVYDDEGRLKEFLAVGIDASERKRAEEALRESRAELESELVDIKLLQSLSAELLREDNIQAFYDKIIEVATQIMHSEYASLQMFYPERGKNGELKLLAFRGFSPQAAKFWEWVNVNSNSACGEALRTGRRVIIPDVEQCDDIEGTEDQAIYRQTGIHAVQTTPLISRSGKLVGMISTHWSYPHQPSEHDLRQWDILVRQAADLIERKRLEDETLASERGMLKVTIDSILEGVLAFDLEARVLFINETAARLIGYSQNEAFGQLVAKVFYVVDNQTSDPILLTDNQTESQNPILVTRDLREIPISLNSSPILTSDGRMIGTVVVFADITEKQRIEQELSKADKLESLGILAGGIAHDFNNILAAILANLQLAMRKLKKHEDISLYLNNVVETTRNASDLTKQLLTFSKGGAPIKKDTSLIDLLKDTVEFVLRGSPTKADFKIPDDLWVVSIDEGQISQVLHNLALNAKQAMPKGGIIQIAAENLRVEAGTLEGVRLTPGHYLKITVKDQGTGIPKGYLSKIFDPFFTTKKDGNGLGLASSYSIIKQHNGYIEVESEEGVGTTFFIYLPAFDKALVHTETAVEAAAAGESLTILLMDDEAQILNAVGAMLESYGHRVVLTKDGAETIEKYKQAKASGEAFDVVVMDLTIPGGMGGQEAIAHLRDIDPQVKAIVSSGYVNDTIMADYERFGFCGVVTKPYKFDELNEVLNRVVEQKQLSLKLGFSDNDH